MEAAVCASHGAMCSLLWKLGALLSDEYRLLTKLKADIMFLKDELESMHAFLKKMSEVEDPDEQSKCWRKEVRELSYDIEDIIDSFIFSLGCESSSKPRGFKGFIGRCLSLCTDAKTRHWIAKKIRFLKVHVVEASNRRQRYKVEDAFPRPCRISIDPRLPAFYTETTRLVGIDGPRDKLIKLLTEGHGTMAQLNVVSIVGFGGLGKTTLANEVYCKLEGQFDYKAFVSVSQKPDMKKILRNILCQHSCREFGSSECDEQQLINTIRQFLKDKRYAAYLVVTILFSTNFDVHFKSELQQHMFNFVQIRDRYFIVIDDIWNTSAWRTIRCAFPENNCSSRILTTTRIIAVAKYCCSPHHGHVYELKPLGGTHSKSLFFKRVFGSEDMCPLHLKEVSNKILKKCSGLPLAIITIASLLATKARTKEEWEKIWKSIGSVLEKDTDMEDMKKILSLSYNDLPYHLKTCLLYLSVFPEDYEIKRDRLVRRWIAEGFITIEGGHDMEEIGEYYFNDLINRNMIQPVGIQYDGRADACRVHDMILDLIISKSVEENFVTLCGDQNHKLVPQGKVRRLSLNYYARDDIMVPTNMIVSTIRSLTAFGYSENMPCLSDFQLLRVLDLENRVVLEYNYLKHIDKLSHLRYLRLNSRRITALPEQIGELQNLQTLDLRWTRIQRLPESIVLLRRLTCLLVNSLELPEGIGNMQALRELSEIEINCHTSVSSLLELGSLTNLRILGLNWCIIDTNNVTKTYAENLVTSLCKLGMLNLRSIQIQSYHRCSLDFLQDSWSPPPRHLQKFDMSIDYYFPRIPIWMESLEYLTYLDIYLSPVDEESFQTLGDLPNLLFLWISSSSVKPKEGVIIGSNGFRCLKEFYFSCWEIRTGLTFEAGAMTVLEKLRVPFNAHGVCSLHGGLDFGIQHLSSLKHLQAEIVCHGARLKEVEAVEEAVKNAVSELSDELSLEVRRWDEEEILKDEEHKLAEDEFDTYHFEA